MKIKSHMLGGTLIEVLIAALILAIGLFALISFQAELIRERGLINQKAIALTLAQDKIQALRNYTVLTTTVGQFAYADIISSISTTTTAGTTFTTTWTVTDLTAPIRKNVDVTVSWTDPLNVAQTIMLSTIIAKINPTFSGRIAEDL